MFSPHSVGNGQTVNDMYYKDYIQKILRPVIRRKSQEFLAAGPIILNDNAASHASEGVTSLLASYKWETVPHTPYSPDLSQCDFELFHRLKENMGGVRFVDLEELEDVVAEHVRMYERGCLATGIQLASRWRSVIELKRHYLEGF